MKILTFLFSLTLIVFSLYCAFNTYAHDDCGPSIGGVKPINRAEMTRRVKDIRDMSVEQHSFHYPMVESLDFAHFMDYWDYGRATVITDHYVRLTPQQQSRTGFVTNNVPCKMHEWEVAIGFRIHNSKGPRSAGADGFAFWYTKEQIQSDGKLLGHPDNFVGLGVLVDTYDNRVGTNSPKIIGTVAMPEAHRTKLSPDDDFFDRNSGGTASNSNVWKSFPVQQIRTTVPDADDSHVLFVKYENRRVTVSIQLSGATEFRKFEECFVLENVVLPPGFYFTLTAATGGIADNHDITFFYTKPLIGSSPATTWDHDYEHHETEYNHGEEAKQKHAWRQKTKEEEEKEAKVTDENSPEAQQIKDDMDARLLETQRLSNYRTKVREERKQWRQAYNAARRAASEMLDGDDDNDKNNQQQQDQKAPVSSPEGQAQQKPASESKSQEIPSEQQQQQQQQQPAAAAASADHVRPAPIIENQQQKRAEEMKALQEQLKKKQVEEQELARKAAQEAAEKEAALKAQQEKAEAEKKKKAEEEQEAERQRNAAHEALLQAQAHAAQQMQQQQQQQQQVPPTPTPQQQEQPPQQQQSQNSEMDNLKRQLEELQKKIDQHSQQQQAPASPPVEAPPAPTPAPVVANPFESSKIEEKQQQPSSSPPAATVETPVLSSSSPQPTEQPPVADAASPQSISAEPKKVEEIPVVTTTTSPPTPPAPVPVQEEQQQQQIPSATPPQQQEQQQEQKQQNQNQNQQPNADEEEYEDEDGSDDDEDIGIDNSKLADTDPAIKTKEDIDRAEKFSVENKHAAARRKREEARNRQLSQGKPKRKRIRKVDPNNA